MTVTFLVDDGGIFMKSLPKTVNSGNVEIFRKLRKYKLLLVCRARLQLSLVGLSFNINT